MGDTPGRRTTSRRIGRHLDPHVLAPRDTPPVRIKACARSLTREQLLAAIASVGGSRAAAARVLGISRNTIARKLRDGDAAG